VPFEAVVELTNTAAVGDRTPNITVGHIYRDAQGRTRREQGTSVTISDPVLQTSFLLNTKDKTALQRAGMPSTNSAPKQSEVAPPSRTGNVTKPQAAQADLGKAVIDGHDVIGHRITTRIPPFTMGNIFWSRLKERSGLLQNWAFQS
jgi:hypothetical protein